MMTMEKPTPLESDDTTPLFRYGDVTPQNDGATFSEQQIPIGTSVAEFYAPDSAGTSVLEAFRANKAVGAILKFSAPLTETLSGIRPESQPTVQPFEEYTQ